MLSELIIVVGLMGIVIMMGSVGWARYKRATGLSVTAQTFKRVITQARLRAIYQNVNHFVVFDVVTGSLSVVEDSGATAGVYEADDAVISCSLLEQGVELGMPVASLPHPLGSGAITDAWSLPKPVGGSAWGTGLGLMANPQGRLVSVDATPDVIGFGAVVFNDPRQAAAAVSVGIEGRSGTARAYRLDGSVWSEI